MTPENILAHVGKEAQRILTIENKLFNVVKQPLITADPKFIAPTTSFATYREDGGLPLGVVGADFTPQQPKELFKLFLDGIANNPELSTDTLGYTEMYGGSKVRFSVPVGMISFTNIAGVKDESVVTLNFQTGFDGRTKTTMYLSTLRLVCTNGMKKTFTEYECGFKNTSGNANKSVSLIQDIQKQLLQVETINEMYLALNQVKVNQTQTKKFIEKVTDYKMSEYDSFSTRKKNIVTNMLESIDIEFARTGKTAYGLLQGITHYSNHVASGHENPDFIFNGNGQGLNDKALKFALELVK